MQLSSQKLYEIDVNRGRRTKMGLPTTQKLQNLISSVQ